MPSLAHFAASGGFQTLHSRRDGRYAFECYPINKYFVSYPIDFSRKYALVDRLLKTNKA